MVFPIPASILSTSASPTIAVCVPRIGPYHAARLRAARDRGRLTAVETRRTDQEYAWDEVRDLGLVERRTLLPPGGPDPSGRQIRSRMFDVLDSIRPAAVAVTGWSELDALSALDWCARRRVPAVMMSESQERDAPRSWIKERIKRVLVGYCSAALVGGTPHARYIEKLGMPADRIFTGYDVIDNDWFARGAAAARARDAELRSELRLPQQYFLASSRFIEKKNLERLLRAYARYRLQAGEAAWHLVLLGCGPLQGNLERCVQELSIAPFVRFAGFQQYDELPQYYGLAGAFIHASTVEQWGLVVNEAMATGLPVLVSNACGCAADLVQEGRSGFLFDPLQLDQMTVALQAVSRDLRSAREMGQEGARIIGDWSPRLFRDNLWAAARRAIEAPRGAVRGPERLVLPFLTRRKEKE